MRSDAELFELAQSLKLDVLHLHTAVSGNSLPTVPTIRTVHGHQPYCPSGSRFLRRTNSPCNRAYSAAGCTWGHVVDRCGSVRPANFLKDFRVTRAEMASLTNIPTLTVSSFLKEQMVRSGYSESKITVLYLPAPESKRNVPPPQDGVPHFVFAGRLTPQKGVSWLLKAAKEVTATIHIDIAGDGYLEADLRMLAKRIGVADRVTFHGWVDADAINGLLAQARALVFPSVWHEPGGTVAFEAMVNSRAVIMSRVGGMPEVVTDGVTGMLVEPNDVSGLARAIERLAADRREAERLGENGYQTVQTRFGLSDHIDRLMSLYEKCRLEFCPGRFTYRSGKHAPRGILAERP